MVCCSIIMEDTTVIVLVSFLRDTLEEKMVSAWFGMMRDQEIEAGHGVCKDKEDQLNSLLLYD